ncbi:MAG: type I-E CRISPR-associated protein Cse2/CasB [Candidatus Nitrosoglobus sp.]
MPHHDSEPDMHPLDHTNHPPKRQDSPITRLARVIGQAARYAGDAHGLDKGERAALARLDPDSEMRSHQVAALTRALVCAELEPENWRPGTWRRWALIAQGMALARHDGSIRLGQQLCSAGVAESRVTRLLTSRGDAFRQLLPRLVRLLVSKEIAPNWHELGNLILNEDHNEHKAEAIRLKIARHYFSSLAKSAKKKTT